MPPRSKVEKLPKAVKAWLDAALADGNFSGYEQLAEQLKAQGYALSKSTVHRYGAKFEERLAAIKIATEQARAVCEAAPDDDDSVNQALLRVTQEKLFTLMIDLEIDPAQIDISKITRSIADLARASTSAKEYAVKVKARAKEAAVDVAQTAKAAGLSAETIEQIKAKILGVA